MMCSGSCSLQAAAELISDGYQHLYDDLKDGDRGDYNQWEEVASYLVGQAFPRAKYIIEQTCVPAHPLDIATPAQRSRIQAQAAEARAYVKAHPPDILGKSDFVSGLKSLFRRKR